MIVSQGDERILESHRREIVVVFCDLRGYTAFTETAEPEEDPPFADCDSNIAADARLERDAPNILGVFSDGAVGGKPVHSGDVEESRPAPFRA